MSRSSESVVYLYGYLAAGASKVPDCFAVSVSAYLPCVYVLRDFSACSIVHGKEVGWLRERFCCRNLGPRASSKWRIYTVCTVTVWIGDRRAFRLSCVLSCATSLRCHLWFYSIASTGRSWLESARSSPHIAAHSTMNIGVSLFGFLSKTSNCTSSLHRCEKIMASCRQSFHGCIREADCARKPKEGLRVRGWVTVWRVYCLLTWTLGPTELAVEGLAVGCWCLVRVNERPVLSISQSLLSGRF